MTAEEPLHLLCAPSPPANPLSPLTVATHTVLIINSEYTDLVLSLKGSGVKVESRLPAPSPYAAFVTKATSSSQLKGLPFFHFIDTHRLKLKSRDVNRKP